MPKVQKMAWAICFFIRYVTHIKVTPPEKDRDDRGKSEHYPKKRYDIWEAKQQVSELWGDNVTCSEKITDFFSLFAKHFLVHMYSYIALKCNVDDDGKMAENTFLMHFTIYCLFSLATCWRDERENQRKKNVWRDDTRQSYIFHEGRKSAKNSIWEASPMAFPY